MEIENCSRPLMISVETINRCNSECFFCPVKVQKRDIGSMSHNLFSKICNEYFDMGGGYLSLTPAIGEFFLDKFWRNRLNILKEYQNINATITTNAHTISFLSRMDILNISDSFDKIGISLYGLDEEEHKHITNKNFFHQAILGVKKLLDFYPHEKIEIGFRLIKPASKEELRLWILEKFNYNINFHENHFYNNWNYLDIESKYHIKIHTKASLCGLPLISFRIYNDGKISFCPCAYTYNSPSFLLGNLNNNTLPEILKLGMRKVKNILSEKKFEDCKNCSIRIEVDEICKNEELRKYPPYYFGA